jgi:hypothetical protein
MQSRHENEPLNSDQNPSRIAERRKAHRALRALIQENLPVAGAGDAQAG